MKPERWRQVEELYHAALERAPDQRSAFLDSACGPDTDLRQALEALLAQGAQAGSFLETPALAMPPSSPGGESLLGVHIGVYRVVSRLGAGGMGEVYRAHDTKLGRDVAIKVLPAALSNDTNYRARFQREAQVLASLNHPNIAAIYGLEENAIVMELVEGENLCGPLPVGEALRIARYIVEALEAAHEKGIVHRDLKPANIKVTPEGVVKVLDFGLAKSVERAPTPGDPGSSQTLTAADTKVGTILGTLAYMAPEQFQGQAVDRRVDIWAFGAVLYEVLTGRRPFRGDSTSDLLAAVLTKDPDWSALPSATPPRVRELLRLCLAKDRKLRLQAIGDARIFLNAPVDEAVRTIVVPRRQSLPWSVAGLLALIVMIAVWAPWRAPRTVVDRPFLQVDLDAGPDGISQPAISTDGVRIVFVSNGHLVIRRLDQAQITPLAGTDGASYPFFSSDGQWVAFFAAGKLQKISVEGGAPVTLCDAPSGRGGSWGDDGMIVAALKTPGGLSRVPSAGGTPQPLTDLKAESPGIVSHRWPQALPGGKGVLFAATNGSSQGSLRVLDPHSGKFKMVVDNSTYGRYLASGYLVYYQRGTLFAAMSSERLEPAGRTVPIVDGVSYNGLTGRADFDLSASGTLVYRRGTAETNRVPSWIYSSGKIERVIPKPGNYYTPRLSPDGTRLALSIAQDGQQSVWMYDLRRKTMTRVSFDASDLFSIWTPDGQFLAFRTGHVLAWTRSDGSGKTERLAVPASRDTTPWSFSADGKWLAFAQVDPQTGYDLWIAPVQRTPGALRLGPPQPLLQQAGSQVAPTISPEGRWVAYSSDESGRFEIYVMPFSPQGTAQGGKWQVSNGGGINPRWSNHARELFYQNPDRRVEVAAYTVKGDSFVAEKHHVWSEKRLAETGTSSAFDVAPDGKRIVALLDAEDAKPETHLRVLLNLDNELRRRTSAGNK